MIKQERYFYLFLFSILAVGVLARVSIFGIEGLLQSQHFSLGHYLDAFFLNLANDYSALIEIANPYILTGVIAFLAQSFVTSISAYLYYFYPQLRNNKSKEHLKGRQLLQWYKENSVNIFFPIVLPFIRIAVLIGTILIFIKPLSQEVILHPSTAEFLIVAFLFSASIIPHLLISETVFWKDSTVLIHVLLGIICLLFAPYIVLIYFTANALYQAFKVLITQSMDKYDETNT
ncbi:hypothetical protein ACV4QK_21220 (plasmid) [Alteromonas macleodii]|jgi:hypothetical protein